MNKARRSELYNISTELETILNDIIDRIESVKEEETESKENMEEYPQFEMKVMDSEICIDSMDEAISSIQDAIESIKEARDV